MWYVMCQPVERCVAFLDRGLLSAADMMQIQATMDAIEVPSDVGRIPGKIASGFRFHSGSMETLDFSLQFYLLKG